MSEVFFENRTFRLVIPFVFFRDYRQKNPIQSSLNSWIRFSKSFAASFPKYFSKVPFSFFQKKNSKSKCYVSSLSETTKT